MLAEDGERTEGFTSLMQFSSSSGQLGRTGLEMAFDWESLAPGSTVVDAGGGKGHVMVGMAREFPLLKYVVQYRAELVVTVSEEERFESGGSSVHSTAHDFFTP